MATNKNSGSNLVYTRDGVQVSAEEFRKGMDGTDRVMFDGIADTALRPHDKVKFVDAGDEAFFKAIVKAVELGRKNGGEMLQYETEAERTFMNDQVKFYAGVYVMRDEKPSKIIARFLSDYASQLD